MQILIFLFVVYMVIALSYQIIVTYPFVLVILFFLIVFVYFVNKKEEADAKKRQDIKDKLYIENRMKIEKLHETLTNELRSVLEKNSEIVISAYRNTVTTNSFGKKNYKKLFPDLYDFLNEQKKLKNIVKQILELELDARYNPYEKIYHTNFQDIDSYINFEDLNLEEALLLMIENIVDHENNLIEFDQNMSPYEYEHFCADIFKKAGWKADVTKGSSDQGVDITISKNNEIHVVQCKKFSKQVSNKAVQEVVAGIKHYNALSGVVVAPNGFTKSAISLAKSNNIKLIHHSEIYKLVL